MERKLGNNETITEYRLYRLGPRRSPDFIKFFSALALPLTQYTPFFLFQSNLFCRLPITLAIHLPTFLLTSPPPLPIIILLQNNGLFRTPLSWENFVYCRNIIISLQIEYTLHFFFIKLLQRWNSIPWQII